MSRTCDFCDRDALKAEIEHLRSRLVEVVGIVQRTLQPAGSPPPGGEEILIRWICDSANARLAAMTESRDSAVSREAYTEARAVRAEARLAEAEAREARAVCLRCGKMKFVCRTRVWGWVLTGIIGRHGRWFLGYSRAAEDK